MPEYNSIEDFLSDSSFVEWVRQTQQSPQWEQWLLDHPEKRVLAEQATDLLKAMEFTVEAPGMEEMFTVKQEIDAQIARKEEALGKGKQRNIGKYWYASIAAVITLLLVWGSVWWWGNAPEKTIYSTAFGQMDSLWLEDGTLVLLNGNTRLEVAKQWSTAPKREVWLEGEAFFYVKKSPDHPFVVHSSVSEVKVLGTAFNMEARAEHSEVYLEEGKVEVTHTNTRQKLLLSPNELAIVEVNQLTKQTVKGAAIVAWRKQLLAFDNATLEAVARELRNTFGYEVQFANDSLRHLLFTGSSAADNLSLLVKSIAQVHNLTITTDKNTISVSR
ncbi:FecR domain-containing protein [Rapidithrix thailandica]|uniref:FecR domain-containing protein n=1 Tax=Rapidithrix thailandica TaxID=413964 RepID=A0AAW9RZW9_9BACT